MAIAISGILVLIVVISLVAVIRRKLLCVEVGPNWYPRWRKVFWISLILLVYSIVAILVMLFDKSAVKWYSFSYLIVLYLIMIKAYTPIGIVGEIGLFLSWILEMLFVAVFVSLFYKTFTEWPNSDRRALKQAESASTASSSIPPPDS